MSLFENLNSIYSIKNDIKSALENKGVDMTSYSFPDYPSVISDLSGGGGNLSELWVGENGTYYPDQGYDGFNKVEVIVKGNMVDIVFTENGTYDPFKEGYDGWAVVTVSVSAPEKEITEGVDFSSISNDATKVGPGAFAFSPYLTTVSLETARQIQTGAFYGCSRLSSVYLPAVIRISSSAFYSCTSLTSIELPNYTTNYNEYEIFAFCENLSYVSMPQIKVIGENMFENCYNLQTVYAPEVTKVSSLGFFGCFSLSNITLGSISYVGQAAFWCCSSLLLFSEPECSYVGDQAFSAAQNLSYVSIPKCTHLGRQTFEGCTSLSQLTIGTETYTDAPWAQSCLIGTPFENGIGSIYVDGGAYDDFINSPFWSSYSSLFVSVGTSEPMLKVFEQTGRGVYLSGKTMYLYSDWRNALPGQNVSNIAEVSLSNCQKTQNQVFSNMPLLQRISLPEALSVGQINNCPLLTSVYVPKLTYCNGLFNSCPSLSIIDFPAVQSIRNGICFSCPSVTTLILGYTGGVVSGFNSRMLSGTEIAAGNGSIFVPEALVDEYKSAIGWSYFSSQIFPISE